MHPIPLTKGSSSNQQYMIFLTNQSKGVKQFTRYNKNLFI